MWMNVVESDRSEIKVQFGLWHCDRCTSSVRPVTRCDRVTSCIDSATPLYRRESPPVVECSTATSTSVTLQPVSRPLWQFDILILSYLPSVSAVWPTDTLLSPVSVGSLTYWYSPISCQCLQFIPGVCQDKWSFVPLACQQNSFLTHFSLCGCWHFWVLPSFCFYG